MTNPVFIDATGQTTGTLPPQTMQGNYVYNVGNVTGPLAVSVPAGSMVIVNITGTLPSSLVFTAPGLNPSDVVWNYLGPTTSISGGSYSLQGILLAPNTNINITSGTLTGMMVVNALTMNGTMTFAGPGFPEIPEPSSLSIVAIGTVALLGYRFIRRRKDPG